MSHDEVRRRAAEVRYRRSDRIVVRRAHGALYLLPFGHDDVVVLTGTATEIWEAFDHPRTIENAARDIADAFDLPSDEVEPGVASAVADLVARDVLAAA